MTDCDTSGSSNRSSHQTSSHLLELQKEIKEEEEEIFADINSLINSRSNLYSTLDDFEDDEDHINHHESKHFLPTITKPPISSSSSSTIVSLTTTKTINNNIQLHKNNYESQTDNIRSFYEGNVEDGDDEDDELQPNDYRSQGANNIIVRNYQNKLGTRDDDEASQDMDHFHLDSGPPPEEVDFMQQDTNLYGNIVGHQQEFNDHEDDYANDHHFSNCNQSNQQNYQAFQAVIQQVTSNLPKPCVFFLEGNCRRSDCKYSHDLSNITCKYWIEGFCFKGEMCPFLHSYNPPGDPNCLDDDGLDLMSKKEIDPTFAIESEADFPSLPLDAPASALNDSTESKNNNEKLTSNIKNQILSSNPAVVFKTIKKKRKRG